MPLLSIILPVRNESATLPALLTSLGRQDFPPDEAEIVVADGRSIDNTREIVRRFASESAFPVKLVDNPGIRSAAGRNAGLRAASGDFILFIDGHCQIPSERLFCDTLLLFEQTGADCLCRPQPLLAPVNTQFGSAIAVTRASALGHGLDSLIYDMTFSGFVDPASSGAAYRRKIFSGIGNYDERFDACEDVELNTRLRKNGGRAYTDPRLAVFYEPRTSLSSLMRQMVRYGRGRVRLMHKHKDCITATQTAPATLVALLLATMLSTLFHASVGPWGRVLLFIPALVYLGALLISSLQLALKSGPRLLYQAPAIYFVIHCGLGIGMWMEALLSASVTLAGNRPPLAAKLPQK